MSVIVEMPARRELVKEFTFERGRNGMRCILLG